MIDDIEPPARRPSWTKPEYGLKMEVWRSRFYSEGEFSYRNVSFSVSGLAVGALREWRGRPIANPEDFLWIADGIDHGDYEAAEIIRRLWKHGHSPFDFGTIVRFERLTIQATSKSADIWALINYLIIAEFGISGSLLLLKAFPLEYEGTNTDHTERFRYRKEALCRLYTKRLSMCGVPGRYGQDGWMWRQLRYCSPPELPTKNRKRREKAPL